MPGYPGDALEALESARHDQNRLFLPRASLVRVILAFRANARRLEPPHQPADQRGFGLPGSDARRVPCGALASVLPDAAIRHVFHSPVGILDRRLVPSLGAGAFADGGDAGGDRSFGVRLPYVPHRPHDADRLAGLVYPSSIRVCTGGVAETDRRFGGMLLPPGGRGGLDLYPVGSPRIPVPASRAGPFGVEPTVLPVPGRGAR